MRTTSQWTSSSVEADVSNNLTSNGIIQFLNKFLTAHAEFCTQGRT